LIKIFLAGKPTQAIKYLPSKHEDLTSSPNAAKKKKERESSLERDFTPRNSPTCAVTPEWFPAG
jgi:hypothetical protein